MNHSLMNNIQTFLQGPKGYKKSWVRSFLGALAAIIIFIVVLVIAFQSGPMSVNGSSTEYGRVLAQVKNAPMINNAAWLSIAGLSLFGLPVIYLFSLWMVGVNQVSKSHYFHFFVWIIVFVAIILALIAMLFLIRAGITNIN